MHRIDRLNIKATPSYLVLAEFAKRQYRNQYNYFAHVVLYLKVEYKHDSNIDPETPMNQYVPNSAMQYIGHPSNDG